MAASQKSSAPLAPDSTQASLDQGNSHCGKPFETGHVAFGCGSSLFIPSSSPPQRGSHALFPFSAPRSPAGWRAGKDPGTDRWPRRQPDVGGSRLCGAAAEAVPSLGTQPRQSKAHFKGRGAWRSREGVLGWVQVRGRDQGYSTSLNSHVRQCLAWERAGKGGSLQTEWGGGV